MPLIYAGYIGWKDDFGFAERIAGTPFL